MTRLAASGSSLTYSTYLGGSGADSVAELVLDNATSSDVKTPGIVL